MKKLLLALVLCSLVLCVGFAGVGTAGAGASTPTLKSLAKAVAALQKKTNKLNARLSTANATITTLQGKLATDEATIATLQSQLAAHDASITTLQGKLATDEATIAGLSTTVTGLDTAVTGLSTTVAGHTQTLSDAASLLAIAPYVSLQTAAMNGVAGPNIVFQGANVHVRSAESETDGTGTGNLIVGWNDEPGTVARTGSNNLVAGDANNFASHGGFVCGSNNAVTAAFSSVSGGSSNVASGVFSSVSGGGENTASSSFASVSGGGNNLGSADYASVSGGRYNRADGSYSSILGGGAGNSMECNTASGMYSSIVGGRGSSITGDGQWGVVCGGYANRVGVSLGTVGGGNGVGLTNVSLGAAWAAGGSSQTVQYLTYNVD